MYVIKKIIVDNKSTYIGSETLSIIKNIGPALLVLEDSVKNFVREECGKQINTDIIRINKIDQICEPLIDTMLIYALESDPHKLYVYQRKTKEIPAGWVYSKSIMPEFGLMRIFELEHNEHIQTAKQPEFVDQMIRMGPIQMPKRLTQSPFTDLVAELKKSSKYLERVRLSNLYSPSESAPKI